MYSSALLGYVSCLPYLFELSSLFPYIYMFIKHLKYFYGRVNRLGDYATCLVTVRPLTCV